MTTDPIPGNEAPATALVRSYFDHAPAGFAIMDTGLRYLHINEALADLNGVPVSHHIGRSVRSVLPAFADLIEPLLERVIATGEPLIDHEWSGEIPGRPGRITYGTLTYFPIQGSEGPPLGVGAIVREETMPRVAGIELHAIIDQAAYGVFQVGLDGTLRRVNQALARLLGYGAEADVLKLDPMSEVYVHPDQWRRITDLCQMGGVIKAEEVEWKGRDGQVLTLRLSGAPVRDSLGHSTAYTVLAENVTDQRTTERALHQAQKMKAIGELTGGIAHDFNNLLTIILAQADLMASGLPEGRPDLRRDLTTLSATVQQGAELVQKLMGFSRSGPFTMRPLDLTAHVEDTVANLRRLLPASIAIELHPKGGRHLVEADRVAVTQILMNLTTNARDAMPEGGTLHIDIDRTVLHEDDRPLYAWIAPGPYVRLQVSDTGIGMDQATLGRVLEPFFTTKPAGVGTGLGMAMVYGLVKRHKGCVHLYSEVGLGTTIQIYLPRVEATEGAAAGHPATLGALPGGHEVILVVEDEPRLREAAARLLRKAGYQVTTAEDGIAALQWLEEGKPAFDLIIADMQMPRMGGLALYKTLRERGVPVTVLFTSGAAVPIGAPNRSTDPRTGFLIKPWTTSELLINVRALLDGRPAEAPVH